MNVCVCVSFCLLAFLILILTLLELIVAGNFALIFLLIEIVESFRTL